MNGYLGFTDHYDHARSVRQAEVQLQNENEWRDVCAMKLGYARVTNEQDTVAQMSALKSAECEKYSARKRPQVDGIGRSHYDFWIKCV